MRLLVYALPIALSVLVTGPIGTGDALAAKAADSGAGPQEFSSSRRKYSGPRGGAR